MRERTRKKKKCDDLREGKEITFLYNKQKEKKKKLLFLSFFVCFSFPLFSFTFLFLLRVFVCVSPFLTFLFYFINHDKHIQMAFVFN
jgi:hypothetical protein